MGKIIESFEINSFRGIKSLKIKDLGILNFFVGVNNCGKTSVLEALQLLEECSWPMVDLKLMQQRGFPLPEVDFSSLFFNCKTENSIQVKVKGSNKIDYSLTIEKKKDLEKSIILPDESEKNSEDVIAIKENFTHTYCARFPNGVEQKETSTLNFRLRKPRFISDSDEIETSPGFKICQSIAYVSPRSIVFDPLDLQNVMQEKREPELIKILRFVDPRIVDIMPVPRDSRPSAMVDVGLNSRLPLEVLGDGVRRVLLLALKLLNAKEGFLLIDEIENGLHFETLVPVLRAIVKAAIEQNVQIFVTTHSLDVLRAIQKGFTEKDDVRVINLVQLQDRHKAYSYHYSEINQLLKQEVEIR